MMVLCRLVFLASFLRLVHAGSKIIKTKPTFNPNSTHPAPKCNSALRLMTGGDDCMARIVPMAYALSGGQCYALLTQGGWFRAAVLNPEVGAVAQADTESGGGALTTATNSGGTMFWIRYLALKNYRSSTKWAYPCFMLDVSYRTLCNFHSDFGGLNGICEVEAWQVVSVSVNLVYGSLFMSYGGPLGSAMGYAFTYFPFIHNLPLTEAEKGSIQVFSTKFVPWATLYDAPDNFLTAYARVSPTEASRGIAPYNFGWSSFLPRDISSYGVTEKQCSGKKGSLSETCDVSWCLDCQWYSNFSLGRSASWSAAAMAGFQVLPFAWTGKSWDSVTGMGLEVTMTLKVLSMGVSYVMVQRLLTKRTVANGAMAPYCESGCPVLDGAFADNGPLTQTLSTVVTIPRNIRPALIFQSGPASSFAMFNFQLGKGPMVMTGGINMCPFGRAEICGTLAKLRSMYVENFDQSTFQEYKLLRNAFDVYMPSNQVVAPFCGDPLAYDIFHASCSALSFCSLQSAVVPSQKMAIAFTVEPVIVVLAVTYLGATPLAKSFVHNYIPNEVRDLPYFNKMEQWFPAFANFDPERGAGGAWTKVAGHSVYDYMTYLCQRVAGQIYKSKEQAWRTYDGSHLSCGYELFLNVFSRSLDETSFGEKQLL